MELVESISKTLYERWSLATDSPKSLDPEAKTPQEAVKAAALSVLMDGTWGNGVGVLLDVKGVGGDHTGVVAGEADRTKPVEAETSTELEKEGIEDSEMNGVSSLLKMRASSREIDKHGVAAGDKGKPAQGLGAVGWDKEQGLEHDEPTSGVEGVLYDERVHSEDGGVMEETDAELQEMSQEAVEESDEELDDGGGYEFSVGDFVWGKIKSHPWWPGRVYDPSDASDFAVKKRLRSRLLVAYFGDNSFAWCHASQLKPFAENFRDLSKLSHSRNFLTAVEDAVDEIERLVVLNLTCSCVQERTGTELEWPKASGAGIKEGACVRGAGIGLSEPAEVIAKLKLFAETVSNTNLLDCVMLKGWLLAFYGSKGLSHLPTYHQPVPIPGLEDPTETLVVDMSKYSNFTNAPVQGPVEEDLLFHPSEGTSRSLSENYENVLGDGMYHSRKQKSIAEILEVAKSVQTARRKRTARKGSKSDKLEVPSSTRMSKRKGIDGANGNDDQTSGSTKTTSKRSKPSGSVTGMRSQTSDSGSDGNSTKEETVEAPSKRKSKDRSSNDGSGRENFSSSSLSTKKKMEMHGSLSVVRDDDDENIKQIEGTSSPRERKKSKYLSPPYTTSNARQKKSDIESEALAVLAETQLRERMTETAGHLLGAPQFLKKCDNLEKKQPAKLDADNGAANELSSETLKEHQNSMIDPIKVDAPADEVISDIRSAARNPHYSKENFSDDTAGVFLSIFRNSVYRNGRYYKVYNKSQSRKKVTSPKSEADVTKREQNQAANGASKSKSQRADIGNNVEAKSSKRKSKQDARMANKQTVGEVSNRPKTKNAIKTPTKNNDEDSDEEAPPAVLFVSFGPGTSLPSKDDLIKIFGKYGPLDRNYTDISVSNFCARVVFRRSFDAEKAFSASQLASPFGATNVTLQLRFLTASSELRELKDLPSTRAASVADERIEIPENSSALLQADGKSSEVEYVRHKLEMLTAMLASSGETMSPGMKSKLQMELKGLLKKVSTIAAA